MNSFLPTGRTAAAKSCCRCGPSARPAVCCASQWLTLADALKKINISAMSHREIEDALSEVRFLASIRHPCIIGFLEAFVNPASMELCIVQEFADGGDLAGKIQSYARQKRGMPEKE